MNVVDQVAEKGFCSGCGLCAAVCPEDVLSMFFDESGELRPKEGTGCTECGICLEVCPFSGRGPSIDDVANSHYGKSRGMDRTPILGHSFSCRKGHIVRGEFRTKGASGGAASWFLTRLLERGDVDAVLLAGPDQNRPGFWTFRKVINPEEVIDFTGSVYHSVPITEALKTILQEKETRRYAVIALPCLAYGLRKAASLLPALGERLAFLASITCGMIPTHRYQEYASLESGVLPKDLLRMDFRRPPEEDDSDNYRHAAVAKNGSEGKTVPAKGLPQFLWGHGGCIQGGCLICDDVFGEAADVVFMDAWLPEFKHSRLGNSLIISRHPLAEKIADEGTAQGECRLEIIPPEDVVRAQADTILMKRTLLGGRLARMEKAGQVPPPRRVKPDRDLAEKYREFFDLCDEVRTLAASSHLEDFQDLETFRKKMAPLRKREEDLRVRGKDPLTTIPG
ncbi:MAG: Coenzyme F420 hydrogenase/dehydrogenase, beta subunit C-terminal domain [Thermovirgaceae bacterium]